MTQQIQLYYKNATDKAVGGEHGLTSEQLDSHSGQIARIVDQINGQVRNGQLPYRTLPSDDQMHSRVVEIADELRSWCKNFVVLGIGGSALGNIALQTALNQPYYNLLNDDARCGPRLFVMDNVDPDQFAAMLELLRPQLDGTVFNVISKSGQTAETAAQFLTVRRMLIDAMGDEAAKNHIVVTTDPRSGSLRQVADDDGYRTLEVPDGVGGRFSVLSHVGLLSAAVCGIDTGQLLAGARDMDGCVSRTELRSNPAAIFALVQYLMYQRGKRMSVMFPYSYRLKDLADWFRQLWAESLGKTDQIGPTPIKALGATDQHSQVQLYREGPNDKVFTFLRTEKFAERCPIAADLGQVDAFGYLGGREFAELINGEQTATEFALVASQRPCMTIMFPRIDAHCVGQFMYMLESATSIAGALFDINAYDQPAVELGKKATFALMGRAGYDELAGQLATFAQIDREFLV